MLRKILLKTGVVNVSDVASAGSFIDRALFEVARRRGSFKPGPCRIK